MTGRRALLYAVAFLLTASAALAIAILLFGDFGETEGKILATTALLAAFGLLATPGAVLFDQRRLLGLAVAVVALALVAAGLSVVAVWSDEPASALGDSIATLVAYLVASTQTAALVARLRGTEAPSLRALFAGSTGLAFVGATMVAVVIWAEIDSETYARVLAALVVLDVLLVALQPILGRARPATSPTRLRIAVAGAQDVELTVEAADVAGAVATAIRMLERNGRRVVRVAIEPLDSEDDQARDGEVRDDREQILDHGRERP